MIQVGSSITLKEDLSHIDLECYAKCGIIPGRQYTVVRISFGLTPREHSYKLDIGYYVSGEHIEDLYSINLEKILE